MIHYVIVVMSAVVDKLEKNSFPIPFYYFFAGDKQVPR